MKYCILPLLLITMSQINAQQKVLYQGEWEADSYFTTFEGSWKIVEEGVTHYVLLGKDFEAKKAPDLKIFLSTLELDKIDGDNAANKSTSILIAQLNKYKGEAKYAIPKNIKVSSYKTIIIHCEKYAKLWGGSSLQ